MTALQRKKECLTSHQTQGASLKSWAFLGLSILIIVLFLFVVGPMGLQTRVLKPMADFIEENNINANAYYYTEVDEFFIAERHMREHLALVPGGSRSIPEKTKPINRSMGETH